MNVRVENDAAQGVEHGVHADRQTMPLENVFWSHFSRNLSASGWVIGVLTATLGLGAGWGIAAIVIGNVLGSIPVAFCAIMGPATGLTQMEDSRFAFGRTGTRLPSLLNWICCVGWDAVNNVPSTIALIALVALVGFTPPFWAALALLVGVQLTATIYGHDAVQLLQKYLGYVLLVVFGIVGFLAVKTGGGVAAPTSAVSAATIMLGISLVASYNIGWAPYSADYTRYLPKATKSWRIFALSFAGMFVSGVAIELCGFLTASKIPDTTPTALITSIVDLTGGFAPLALFAVAISSIAVNSQNDYTAAYSLISAGVRLPRSLSAIVTASLGFVLAVAGAGQFATLFSNYLVVLIYWIAPWAGIVLADWYLCRSGDERGVRGWGLGASVFVVVTVLTIALFSSTSVYTGPIAQRLGGTDVGYVVGFFAAGGAYVLLRPRARARVVAYEKAR
jgi:NCS1 family nucleobase:cation symporter-1